MATQYTDILKLALPVQGELSGTWGDVVNENITAMIEEAIAGMATIDSWTTNAHVLTTADGTTAESRAAMLLLEDGAGLTAAGTVTCPAKSKLYVVNNQTSYTVTIKTSAGTGIAIPTGKTMWVHCDGTNVEEASTYAVNLTVGTFVSDSVDIGGGNIDGTTIGAASAAAGTFTSITATTGITSAGTHLTDNNKLTFGDSGTPDMEMYHDGSNSYIDDAGTGSLYVRTSELKVTNADGTENILTGATDGAVSLYYDNASKLVTTSTGATVTGLVTADTADLGDILVSTNTVYTVDASGTDVAGSDVVVKGGASTGTGAGGSILFQTTPAGATGATVNTFSTVMEVLETGINVTGTVTGTGLIKSEQALETEVGNDGYATVILDTTGKYYSVGVGGITAADIDLRGAFYIYDGNNAATRMKIATDGATSFTGETTFSAGIALPDNQKATFGASDDLQIYHDGSHSYINDTGTGDLFIKGDNNLWLRSAADENYIRCDTDGAVWLYYDNVNKLTTTSTGIDVTGTVTADGLTVDGDVSVSTSSSTTDGTDGAFVDIKNTDGTISVVSGVRFLNGATAAYKGAIFFEDLAGDGRGDIVLASNDVASGATPVGLADQRLRVSRGGDISFYEDTGTTAKFFWDASAESLTVGNASALTNTAGFNTVLGLKGNLPAITVEDTGTGTGKYTLGVTSGNFGVWDNTRSAYLLYGDSSGNVGIGTSSPDHSLEIEGTFGSQFKISRATAPDTQYMTIAAGGNLVVFDSYETTSHSAYVWKSSISGSSLERARIDSSGNLLVGKTASNSAVVGCELLPSGIGSLTASGNQALYLNRLTSDGDIAEFRKDGTTVGSIGNLATSMYISGSTSQAGLLFNGTSYEPTTNGSTRVDNSITIGSGSYRYKDLYLSGGVIAGTGSLFNYTSSLSSIVGIRSTVSATPCIATFNTAGAGSYQAKFYNNNTTALIGSITNNGNIGTLFNTTSDERLKENIVDTTHTVDINDIKVRQYDWKDTGEHQRYGFIAQELELVYPEAVHSPEDPEEMKAVDYSKLVPLLVKEIQDLKAEVAALKGA